MEANDIVVCVHNTFAELTIGKEYKVIGVPENDDNNKVIVISDAGIKNTYYKNRFIKK